MRADGGSARRPGRGPSRRAFLRGTGGLALGLSGAAALAGCGEEQAPAAGPRAVSVASPDNPVELPITGDNRPIEPGLPPERDAVLTIFTWQDYINKDVLRAFEKEYKRYNVKVRAKSFETMLEAIGALRAGKVDADVFHPTLDTVGKVAREGIIRPLQQSYIPNIKQAWPVFENPFYDRNWRYTTPYTVYTTGISWRTDKVSEDISKRSNPYEVFWDPKYKGKVGILDDFRETICMVLLRNGITDMNTVSDQHLKIVRRDLLELARTMQPRITITEYEDLAKSKTWVTDAWSGDMVSAQYYLPEGQDPNVLQYWSPLDGRGPINNDTATVLRRARNPVLAHHFLNFMLDLDNAMLNMSFTGYQAPLARIDPDLLVKEKFIPPSLRTTVVRQEYFDLGFRALELQRNVEKRWEDIFKTFTKAVG